MAAADPLEVPRPLVDSFGRVHRDLRISVTDRCNFRCTYCMPEEGMTWLPKGEVLTFEELERVARVLVERHGIESIRLTGGEPTVRAHLPVLVSKLAALPVDLSLTTNGATLRTVARGLADAGLRRVNVSLDSLRPERFHELTRRDQLDDVLDGIDAAARRRPHAGEGERRRRARRQRRRDRRPGRSSGASAASPCASSSGCPSTPATPGPTSRSSPRPRSSSASAPSSRWSRSAGGASRPSGSATSTAAARWA